MIGKMARESAAHYKDASAALMCPANRCLLNHFSVAGVTRRLLRTVELLQPDIWAIGSHRRQSGTPTADQELKETHDAPSGTAPFLRKTAPTIFTADVAASPLASLFLQLKILVGSRYQYRLALVTVPAVL